MVQQSKQRKCPNCDAPMDRGRYIYPIPDGYFLDLRTDLAQGIKVCLVCAPEIQQAQYHQGLVIVWGGIKS